MLEAIARGIVWSGLGEILTRLGLLPVPGPVLGLVLLYLDLLWHKTLPDDLGRLADRMLALFGLLFVPAGVGIIQHLDRLRGEWIGIAAAAKSDRGPHADRAAGGAERWVPGGGVRT